MGGWGQQSKLKAGVAGDKEGKPPCGHHSGKVSQRPAPHAPHKYHKRPPSQCRRRFSAGVPGAVAPGKIILESPPSPEGKGAGGMGGWGQQSKLKAEVAGGKEGKPPTGCGITLPCPTKKEKIHCRRKIARTPCALPPNMLY